MTERFIPSNANAIPLYAAVKAIESVHEEFDDF